MPVTPRRSALLIQLACILAIALPACRPTNAWDIAQQEAAGATLVVQNNNFSDVDVYVMSMGLATRVGTVTGNSTARFALSASLLGPDDFRVIATPIGGNGRASSGPLLVSSGQTVTFTIAPSLRQSSASVR